MRGKRVNLTGKKFGMLAVLGFGGKSKWGYTVWDCLCECGNTKTVSAGNLNTGATRSCGCLQVINSGNKKDLTGKKFTRLLVIKESPKKHKGERVFWDCKCDCGNTTRVQAAQLISGKTKSCSCLKLEANTTHGLSAHPLKSVWKDMKRRCNNDTCKAFQNYGGRGIIVCDKWKGSFIIFYDWAIKAGWRKGLVLDRKNNDGNYNPDNCRFITHQENCQNTRLLSTSNTSGFRGVSGKDKQFKAYYTVNRKTKYLGTYRTAVEAAEVRDRAVVEAGLPLPLNFNEFA